MIEYTHMDSPVGRLLIVADDEGLRLIEFEHPRYPEPRGSEWRAGDSALLQDTRAQLAAYFDGRLHSFSVPLAPRGSAFQQRVWKALLDIPHGVTCSYADIARGLGGVRATRAVGAANGRNPIPIIVPCHRVIGADGSLVGYGGGVDIKRFLLRLEGALRDDHSRQAQLRLGV